LKIREILEEMYNYLIINFMTFSFHLLYVETSYDFVNGVRFCIE